MCKGFGAGETRTEVLKEVNFEAHLGELLLLVGPSGCGKTTLLSVIAGNGDGPPPFAAANPNDLKPSFTASLPPASPIRA